eukprot:3714906-Prymnesium_polylepis.1
MGQGSTSGGPPPLHGRWHEDAPPARDEPMSDAHLSPANDRPRVRLAPRRVREGGSGLTVIDASSCSTAFFTPQHNYTAALHRGQAGAVASAHIFSSERRAADIYLKLFLWALPQVQKLLYFDLDSVLPGNPLPFIAAHKDHSFVAEREDRPRAGYVGCGRS